MEQGMIAFLVGMLVTSGVVFHMAIDAVGRELKTLRRLQADVGHISTRLAVVAKTLDSPLPGVVSPEVYKMTRLREILEDDNLDDATARITALLVLDDPNCRGE